MNMGKDRYNDDLFDENDNEVAFNKQASNSERTNVHQASYEEAKFKESVALLERVRDFCNNADEEIKKVQSIQKCYVEKLKDAQDAYEKYCSYMQYLRGEEVGMKYRLERVTFDISKESCQNVKKLIDDSMITTAHKVLVVTEKQLEDIAAKFSEKIAAEGKAQMDIVQKRIEEKEEEIKQMKKAGGYFLTSGQMMYLLLSFFILWAVAMWGFARILEPWKSPQWVGILLAVALSANLLWYAVKWIWRRIPGNND